jgi:two-component system OmpR family response regulator
MAIILVADDEEDMRELIALALQLDGHQVILTSDGQQAYDHTVRESPDLVLVDVGMPKMTGYQVCKQLKKNRKTRNIPVVFLSAKGREAEVQAGLEAGGAAYILKPFALHDFRSQINTILQKHYGINISPR